MKTRNSEQYTMPTYAGIEVVPVLDNLLKNITLSMAENVVYIPIPHKKFRVRKFKSNNWNKRRDEKITKYITELLEKGGVKV